MRDADKRGMPKLAVWSLVVVGGLAVVPVVITLLGHTGASYARAFRREVDAGLARARPEAGDVVSEVDLAPLPAPVQRYLRFVGVVGKPRVQNLRAVQRGEMRASPTAPWMASEIEQYDFFDPPSRLFLMRARRFGVPFEAYHRYVGPAATMEVKVASLVKVVDARGKEMNQSETVTLFNDMCLLAPATLIDAAIKWHPIDDRRVAADFSNAGNTIRATLFFGADGALENFTSDDRYQSSDGKTYRKYRWSTPVRSYRDFGGLRLPADGEASWAMPEGELVYARFSLDELAYNVVPLERPGVALERVQGRGPAGATTK
jgi:hypothetical protein